MSLIKFYRPVNRFEGMIRTANEIAKNFELNSKIHNSIISPRVDIIEDSKEYRFMVEMPGLTKEDVKITISDENILQISGKKSEESSTEESKDGTVYHRIERYKGEFIRKFVLPENANKESITAKHEDGLLTITIDKTEPEKPKEIEVSIS